MTALHLLLGPFLSIVLVVIGGCGSPSPTGYRTYTLLEGAGHFSFEYPARIPVKTVHLGEDGNFTMVDLFGPVSPKDGTRTRVWITATRSPGMPPDFPLYLESALGVAESLSGYRFIDRSNLVVAGETAEQISYANMLHRSDYETRVLRLSPYTVINRHIYLTHGDAVWTISITATADVFDIELTDFERLLASFSFLG